MLTNFVAVKKLQNYLPTAPLFLPVELGFMKTDYAKDYYYR